MKWHLEVGRNDLGLALVGVEAALDDPAPRKEMQINHASGNSHLSIPLQSADARTPSRIFPNRHIVTAQV